MSDHDFTRRRMIALTGGAAATGLAGCLGGDDEGTADEHPGDEHAGGELEEMAYVVTYHWGYAAFDEDGTELDVIDVDPGTELTLQIVNDHAYDAFEALPDPVAAELEDFDALERTKQKVEAGELPEPDDATVEDVYDKAHGRGHDDGHDDEDDHGDNQHRVRFLHEEGDGHDDDGHDDDHGHDDAMLDHGFAVPDLNVMVDVPADKHDPVEETVVVDSPGTYKARCTVGCGYYHAHQEKELIVATEN